LIGDKELATATLSREVKRARQFFRAACRNKIIQENPFEDIKTGKQVNKSREYFVDRPTINAVIEAAPDYEWRLIIAFCRYAGLRCPSEILPLQWTDINWHEDGITVHSPKTEHHDGGESRVVPVFPVLLPYLLEARQLAGDGTAYVITRYRHSNANLRTQFERIIRRAGYEPWPRIFQNLRSSRETELLEEGYPIQAVCEWIGNSPEVAKQHYLQMRDVYFRRAVEGGSPSGSNSEPVAPGVAHKVARQAAATRRTPNEKAQKNRASNVHMPSPAACCTGDQYPLGESNPCLWTENPMSWATRRRGQLP